eukprot:547289_1
MSVLQKLIKNQDINWDEVTEKVISRMMRLITTQKDQKRINPVKVTATDKYDQQVKDSTTPKQNIHPYASAESIPSKVKVKQPVQFDASTSHDQATETTKGVHPTTVIVKDKNGLQSDASLNQKVLDTNDEKSSMKSKTYSSKRVKEQFINSLFSYFCCNSSLTWICIRNFEAIPLLLKQALFESNDIDRKST